MWAYLAITLVSAVVAYALMPRVSTPDAKPNSLSDFNIPTADESRAIPVVFGTVKVQDPNVVWYGDLTVNPIRKRGGGKK